MEHLQQPKRNPMATASMVLGSLAIFLSFIMPVYALFSGCLGILFATLSRGSGLKLPDKALVGIITSVFALFIAALVTAIVLYLQQLFAQRFGTDILQDPEALQKLLTELMNNYANQLQTGGTGL